MAWSVISWPGHCPDHREQGVGSSGLDAFDWLLAVFTHAVVRFFRRIPRSIVEWQGGLSGLLYVWYR